MNAAMELSRVMGVEPACLALGVNRASFYRQKKPGVLPLAAKLARPRPPWALADDERQVVLDLLHSERFVDLSPREIHATLLDEGVYHCSVRTMYRILDQEDEVRERRRQRRHPVYAKPELVATGPNQVWSWDITKLKAADKGSFFHLYVILDIYSRYVVGWMVATSESGELAKRLIGDTCEKQGIQGGMLTIHSDRGTSMKSKSVSTLLSDLDVAKSHSRPKVSNDNPFSESQFKTLKYHPGFPERFGSLEDAQTFCRSFFPWYNNEHRHSGIAYLTPSAVHHGEAANLLDARRKTLDEAAQRHPGRFKGKLPKFPSLQKAVWINLPQTTLQENAVIVEYYCEISP